MRVVCLRFSKSRAEREFGANCIYCEVEQKRGGREELFSSEMPFDLTLYLWFSPQVDDVEEEELEKVCIVQRNHHLLTKCSVSAKIYLLKKWALLLSRKPKYCSESGFLNVHLERYEIQI